MVRVTEGFVKSAQDAEAPRRCPNTASPSELALQCFAVGDPGGVLCGHTLELSGLITASGPDSTFADRPRGISVNVTGQNETVEQSQPDTTDTTA